ncbi:hypothetical protein B5X24_HaOG200717 [Helicoverpa armigera]|uniref:Gustatory receptor n=1 Tax=Helicoverpa armigera TaxID=29058 RepID=A0A2W1BV44_HELAM|nr:hypothetical protein B5X24_HaOG200717 [Helicoverpa armigera]
MRSHTRQTFRQHGIFFPFESILNNQLDKDVQSILFPLNLLQFIVLNPKCHIKNSFINPNNSFNKVILFFGMIIYVSAYIYRVLEITLDVNLRAYGTLSFLYIASYFDFAFYSTGFILNSIINFCKTKDMVNLILMYQDVNRFLKDKSNFRWSVIRSWIYVALIIGFYVFTMLFMSVAPFHIVFNLIILISLDSNIIYTIILLKLLTEKVVVWNSAILKVHKNGCSTSYCTKMFDVYVDIFSCYNLIKDMFQQPVSLLKFFSTTFLIYYYEASKIFRLCYFVFRFYTKL